MIVKDNMMNLLKKNFDIAFLVVGIALYSFQAAFFPFLLFSFLFLWYRREVLWRIRTENAGSKRNPFRLDKHFEIPTYIIFFVLGWIWVIFWEMVLSFISKELHIAFTNVVTNHIYDKDIFGNVPIVKITSLSIL